MPCFIRMKDVKKKMEVGKENWRTSAHKAKM